MKKYDFYLASAMCFIALVLYLIIMIISKQGSSVSVYKDNVQILNYSLNEDGVYPVTGQGCLYMTFEIKNGKVNVISADCPDKLCVHQKPISLSSETICCLPNKIVLKINETNNSLEKGEYDAVTQ